jgi:type I restriction enzyme S subunit
MNREWKRHYVADLIAHGKLFIGDGYRAKNTELSLAGLPFARAGNIDSGFNFQGADNFPQENLSRVGNKVSRIGDVVFTSKGTVGRFAFVREDTPRFVYSPQLCFWRSLEQDSIHSRFLYYWMLGREFSQQYKSVAGQTDMAEYVSLVDQRRMY